MNERTRERERDQKQRREMLLECKSTNHFVSEEGGVRSSFQRSGFHSGQGREEGEIERKGER